MEFDWDTGKNQANIEVHDIDFEDIKPLFLPGRPYLDKEDDREDYGEERRIRLGWIQDIPVYVVYTIRGTVTWLISARMAVPAEEELLVCETEGEQRLQRSRWEQEQSVGRKRLEEQDRIEFKKEREER